MKLERLQTLQKQMGEKQAWFAFITSKENVFYLTGYRTDPHERLIAFFVFKDSHFLVVPKMEESMVRKAGYDGDILSYSDNENVWENIYARIPKHEHRNLPLICVEERLVSFERIRALQALDKQVLFTDCEGLLMEQRLQKTNEELQTLRAAAAFADRGVELGVAALKTGVTEMEVVAAIEYGLKQQGIREMSFQTTVLFGDHASAPHGKPGNRQLQEGEFVLFDLGVVVDGYCSDITRTVAYGNVSEQEAAIYRTVLKAQEAALAAAKPGAVIGAVDQAARHVITEAGYGAFFPHRLGHGLGIDVHESPSMHQDNHDRLKERMTFTVEPGIYIPDRCGVRIEDDVVITAAGCEAMTSYPKTLDPVPVRL
ncbi:MAG: Xaa-Pro dipeptidase [Shouchella clausii]